MNSTVFRKRLDELKNELIAKKLPDLSGELFLLFKETGNRIEYERVYFERRRFLAVYGLSACFFEKEKDSPAREMTFSEEDRIKLNEVLRNILSEETWALPAHCNLSDPDWRHTVDLFACETASALAVICDRASGFLDEDVKNGIVSEIGKRVICPMFLEDRKFGFECAAHNWNAVCMGSVGIVLLFMGERFLDEASLNDALQRVRKSLKVYIDKAFSDDGASLEGLGYYNYGMSFFVAFAKRLYEKTGGKEDLFNDLKIERIAAFPSKMYFKNGSSVNFSDAATDEKLHPGMMRHLFKHTEKCYDIPHDAYFSFDSDSCYRFVSLYDDVENEISEGFGDTEETKLPESRVDFLEKAEWLIAESENSCGLAIKGGSNDEPHNHNDVGHFIYVAGNRFISADLGAGEYTRDYFGDGRYGILCCSSFGHSLPVIDGQGQKAGKEHRADSFSVVRQGISGGQDEETAEIAIDMTSAYDIPYVTRVARNVTFGLESGKLTVTDTVISERAVDAKTRIISFGDIKKFLTVTGKCGTDPLQGVFVKQDVFSDHFGNKRDVNIYEIEMEESNADLKERDNCGFVYRASYVLHP
jgi:hypothetical protein